MKRFHSYGPVDKDIHLCVPRTELVENCMNQILGDSAKGGHFFTLWAPRQTGKTWLMREVKQQIQKVYPDRFTIGAMSMQGVFLKDTEPIDHFLKRVPQMMLRDLYVTVPQPDSWEAFSWFFSKQNGLFDRPVILFIDEFDSLPPAVIDQLVTMFRDIYLNRDSYQLHGLALIGVKAVLGVESMKGSPFNIQRSLHVPNFTPDEVRSLFDQYLSESGQMVEADVVQRVYDVTNGQPGLVGWFGELLTEKFNPGGNAPIGMSAWETVYRRASYTEWNNTVLNLVAKAKGEYRGQVMDMFVKSDIAFNLRAKWCSYLYLNGIIGYSTQTDTQGTVREICRFSSPFIQKCLFDTLTSDVVGDSLPMPALEILDDLADVFADGLNLSALLTRYKAYLARMKARGLNPFKDQPRRTDLHYTEAVGHFHLYAWLQAAVGRRCVVSPEFPTGNGKVDIHLNCDEKKGIIEVKSFIDTMETRRAQGQAAAYAKSLGLNSVTLALFVPVEDELILNQLSIQTNIDEVLVYVVAIGWT
jgi:AAA-like domain